MLWVIGSVNADLVLEVARAPGAGETVAARATRRESGGKGANLAAAAARLGAPVCLIGATGDDADAAFVRAALASAGVDLTAVARLPDAPTGGAVVLVEDGGENRIVVSAGANGRVGARAVADAAARLPPPVAIATNLEIPTEAALAAMAHAHRTGVPFLLNAAPALPFPLELLARRDVLVVNAQEARTYLGDAHAAPGAALAQRLSDLTAASILVTLGAGGCVLSAGGAAARTLPAPAIAPVDTTGAGDAFCGALAARLTAGEPLARAARTANWVGAFTACRPGAQRAQPTAAELRRFAEGLGAAGADVLP